MDDKRRGEIKKIVERFRGEPLTENVLIEFCNINKIDPIPLGEFEDFLFQYETDIKMVALLKEILAALQGVEYEPMFSTSAEQKRIQEKNEEVRIEVAKIIEKHAVAYIMLDKLGHTLGSIIGNVVESAGTTIWNKANMVLKHIAEAHFGGRFNSKHVADYAEEVYRVDKKKE